LPAVLGLCLVFAAAVAKARRYPVVSFGVLWYLAGHSLESGILGLEIAFEHRNYIPSLGVFLCLSYGAVRYLARLKPRKKSYAPALIGIILLPVAAATWVRAGTWSETDTLAMAEARNHPFSARANDLAARVSLGRNDIAGAVRYTLQGLKAAPGETGFHIDLQIRLALLAHDINLLVEKRYTPQERRDAQFGVQGLPPEIEVSTHANGLRLRYPGSTDAVIARLLREQPVTVHAVVAFEHLTLCLTSGQPSCRPLQAPALNWLILATENPRTGKTYRGIMAANAARLYALQNEFQNALKFMELAADLLPDHLAYRLARIDYMLRLGQTDQAAETMERTKLDWPRNDIQWSINKPLIDGIMDRLRTRGRH
jgi:tetratricopeptide (TPR) repeat protein